MEGPLKVPKDKYIFIVVIPRGVRDRKRPDRVAIKFYYNNKSGANDIFDLKDFQVCYLRVVDRSYINTGVESYSTVYREAIFRLAP